MHVVEIDRDLIARLKKQHQSGTPDHPRRRCAGFRLCEHRQRAAIWFGNLPYNISTPLLFHLADYAEQVYDMHFMLQKEVVERMVAEPGDADFGRLSGDAAIPLLDGMADRCAAGKLRSGPQGRLGRRPPDPQAGQRTERQVAGKLAQVVLKAFAQRRKMLRNTLKGTLDDAGFAALGIDPTRRAEDIPVEDYVRIANYLS